jgi:hypothetical protein
LTLAVKMVAMMADLMVADLEVKWGFQKVETSDSY